MKNTVAVIFGGCSPEYPVSLQSAASVIAHIDRDCYEIVLLGITRDGAWYRYYGDPAGLADDTWHTHDCIPAVLSPDRTKQAVIEFTETGIKQTRIDLAFPVLHGQNGEDGTVQGLIALAGIPLVGCGVLSSALCMDKDRAHKLASLAGVKVPRSVTLTGYSDPILPRKAADDLGYPLFVKPVRAGSSFGITKVSQASELNTAVQLAFLYDDRVIIEQAIDGFEVGCAVLGCDVLTVGAVDEIELADGFFDYKEKYTLETSEIHCPARIDHETAQRIKDTAQTIYRALDCRGFARVDLFLTPGNEIVFNEVNTIPGFTTHSRYPNMMKHAGLDFGQIIQRLLREAEL